MDAIKYLKEVERMCNSFPLEGESGCKGCPLLSREICCMKHMPETVSIVEKWSEEHPQKTRLDDFKEKYPNANLGVLGVPYICCKDLGYVPLNFVCAGIRCTDCWNQPID